MMNNIRSLLKSKIITIFLGTKKKNLLHFFFALIFNLLAALFEGASFALLLIAFDYLTGSSETGIKNHFLENEFSSFLPAPSSSESGFLLFAGIAVTLQILRSIFSYFGRIITIFISTRIQIESQRKVYEQILRFSFSFISKYKVGDLVEYAKSPTVTINVLMDAVNNIILSLLISLSSAITMFILSPKLSLMVVVIFGISGFLLKWVLNKIAKVSCALTQHIVEFSEQAVQSLHGLRAIFIFDRQKHIMHTIASTLNNIAHYNNRVGLWYNSINPVNEIMGIILVGFFLFMGQTFVLDTSSNTGIPILLTFIAIVHRLNGRLQTLVTSIGTMAERWGQIMRLENILSEDGKEFATTGGKALTEFHTSICFKNVNLIYEGKETASLKNITLTIPKGKMIALVGSSGSGKSSLVDLLLRLYEPTEGQILIDNEDIKNVDLGFLRQMMGVVSQDSFMFNETLEENIRFGKLDATLEDIQNAALIAGADEFIHRFPEGYKTLIGERGYRLSGGERQRVALARALVRNPSILILDEATSNLDSHSEKVIQHAMENLKGLKTLVVIAHRLSTIIAADLIYVIEQGQLVETGTHNELLKKGGAYAKYWHLQTSQYVDTKLHPSQFVTASLDPEIASL